MSRRLSRKLSLVRALCKNVTGTFRHLIPSGPANVHESCVKVLFKDLGIPDRVDVNLLLV
jgi:hypothetical protein